MGEIADDMLYGRCCSLCGQYFIIIDKLFEHGYPVYCKECWSPDCNHEKALVDTI